MEKGVLWAQVSDGFFSRYDGPLKGGCWLTPLPPLLPDHGTLVELTTLNLFHIRNSFNVQIVRFLDKKTHCRSNNLSNFLKWIFSKINWFNYECLGTLLGGWVAIYSGKHFITSCDSYHYHVKHLHDIISHPQDYHHCSQPGLVVHFQGLKVSLAWRPLRTDENKEANVLEEARDVSTFGGARNRWRWRHHLYLNPGKTQQCNQKVRDQIYRVFFFSLVPP